MSRPRPNGRPRTKRRVRNVEQEARRALIAARERAGLSREQLAQRLGRPVSFVARIEGGQAPLRVREFYALATALHLDPRELLQRISG